MGRVAAPLESARLSRAQTLPYTPTILAWGYIGLKQCCIFNVSCFCTASNLVLVFNWHCSSAAIPRLHVSDTRIISSSQLLDLEDNPFYSSLPASTCRDRSTATMTTQTGLNLLRLAPVLSSTAVLMYAHDEDLFYSCWVQPHYREKANALLPSWFTYNMKRALWVVLTGFSFSFVSGISNIYTSRLALLNSGASKWYWAGVSFTMAHFLFGRTALGLLSDIQEDRPKGNSTTSMEKWLRMHRVRTLAVDLPAWICFIVGFLRSLES